MKLYSVAGGPPSLAVRQALMFLKVPFELIDVNFGAGDHMNEEFTERNPQKEIPILEDDGFYLGESNAILQYICDKYKPDSNVYPKDPKERAIINHRLSFNISTYYKYIFEHVVGPIFFDYERTPLTLKKLNCALDNFNTYLIKTGKKYVAADHLTIADFSLINSTMCLEGISFDFSSYTAIFKWYNTFKTEYPELWEITIPAIKELEVFEKNRPDLSHLNHPLHPIRIIKK